MIAHDVKQVAPDATVVAKCSMSGFGTKLAFRDVRSSFVSEGKPDMARTARFGRD